MKKIIVPIVLVALLGWLAACSSASASTGQAASTAGAVAGTPGPSDVQISTLTKLVIGTFKLEETEQAVTAEQAQTLLPLWQAVQALSNSDTAASAEMTALEEQIQATLTSEQMNAIDAMQLTRADMQTLLADLGLGFEDGTRQAPQRTPGAGGGPGPGDLGGALGPGGFPGGDPQNLSAEQQATLQARIASGPGLGVPPLLLNALIELLESKAP